MRILQVSNIVSHHQLPLARALVEIVGEDNFRFCAMQVPDPERERLGWNNSIDEPWILRAGERECDRVQFEKWWVNADIVLCGERLFDKMSERVLEGKLCFYMSERWWKPPIGMARLLHPRFLKMSIEFLKVSKYSKFHYLPVGPYAEKDISVLTNLKDRMWKWGYFTELPSPGRFFNNRINNDSIKILWAGRMLDWKKVDTIIKATAELNRNRVLFELTLIGEGPERTRLEKMASELLVDKTFFFRDPVPASQVMQIMSQHDVYVLSSSAYEGWGAVINEAMACGCAVVASRETGAGAAIINDGENGLLFRPGDWRGLSKILGQLADRFEWRQSISYMGQRTIEEIWSPRVVAARFCSVSAALLSNRDVPFYSLGPMSRIAV